MGFGRITEKCRTVLEIWEIGRKTGNSGGKETNEFVDLGIWGTIG
jgi:hypothetical protein